jgi:uncharacterized protein (DUF433 family)
VDSQELIARYIEDDSRRPGPAEARVRDYGVKVWALVGYYLQAGERNPARVAEAYELPYQAVEAVLAYYHQYQAAIDARLAANAEFAA